MNAISKNELSIIEGKQSWVDNQVFRIGSKSATSDDVNHVQPCDVRLDVDIIVPLGEHLITPGGEHLIEDEVCGNYIQLSFFLESALEILGQSCRNGEYRLEAKYRESFLCSYA